MRQLEGHHVVLPSWHESARLEGHLAADETCLADEGRAIAPHQEVPSWQQIQKGIRPLGHETERPEG